MKQRMVFGIGVGLLLAGISGTVQAQSIYNSIWGTNASKAQIKLYDTNRRQLEQKPRPEPVNPGYTGSKSNNKSKHHRSILDQPSG